MQWIIDENIVKSWQLYELITMDKDFRGISRIETDLLNNFDTQKITNNKWYKENRIDTDWISSVFTSENIGCNDIGGIMSDRFVIDFTTRVRMHLEDILGVYTGSDNYEVHRKKIHGPNIIDSEIEGIREKMVPRERYTDL